MKYLKEIRDYYNLSRQQLAQKLSIDPNTITAYENGRSYPSFKVLVKIKDVFQFSLDYIMRGDECPYPRNLNLIGLAEKLDRGPFSASRKNLRITAESLLGKKSALKAELCRDPIKIELTGDFHSNLKNMRNLRSMTQSSLAEKLGITRNLLSQYESGIYPTVDKLAEFSKILDISIHALSTGEKLSFDFLGRDFGQAILTADHFLSLDRQKILITLLEAALDK